MAHLWGDLQSLQHIKTVYWIHLKKINVYFSLLISLIGSVIINNRNEILYNNNKDNIQFVSFPALSDTDNF